MYIKLKQLTEEDKDNINEPSLKDRAKNNPLSQYRRQYIISSENHEIAYLSFDLLPGQDYLTIYEMFIASDFRNKGFGKQLIAEAEKLAKEWGYNKIKLIPKPLESEIKTKELIDWYKRRGFSEDPNDQQALEKNL